MSSGQAIALAAVSRLFGPVPGLVRVSLRVERGAVVLLRGPNGAGKSTLLHVLATALSPTFGGGTVLGFDLVGERREIRRRVELAGHHTRLYDELTAEENLRFHCRLRHVAADRVPDVLHATGLAAVRMELVRGFSHGMRQRLALGRSLLHEPELLLLDEPYAGCDDDAKALVDGIVCTTRERGGTVVVVTHDDTRTRLAPDRIVEMDGGRITGEPVLVSSAGRHVLSG